MTFQELVNEEKQKPYYKELAHFVNQEYRSKVCYPPYNQIFAAFKFNDIPDIKVVILGQDPYHEKNQAHGLSFSVLDGNPLPKSLINIYQELYDDLGIRRSTGELTSWAKQGVFLLNTVLTVHEHEAGSHRGRGWETFTTRVIEELNKDDSPKVFVLWGSDAIRKREFITNPNHLVLTSPHPSPLSAYRGFFGSRPFSKINNYLIFKGRDPIDWR